MSEWTVSGAGDHNDLLNDVLQRVGVDDDEDPVSTGNFVSPTKGSKHRDPSDSPIAENGIPVPLNPADLTPNKDPLEGFTAWIRGQQTTPGSQGRSPTPPGASPFMQTYSGAFHRSSAMVSPAAPRPLNFTPQKPYGGYGTGGMRAIGMDQLQGAAGFGGYGASGTPTRSGVQAPLLPNGTPMHMGTPTTPYPHQSDMSGMGGMYGSSATYNGAYGGGGGGYGNNGGYGGAGMDAMYDPYAGVTAQASAENIRGRVYETAKDQHGCRFLQRLLDAATSYEGAEIAQVIMLEVVPHVAELMTDQYANFLVQKLFDMMPQEVRFRVAQVAGPYMSQIALTPHGTFSIQKMIETIATREEMEIVQQALSKDVVQLVKDVHGNHVIQKVLQRFEHPDKQFIYDAMASDCVPIATNKQGCCVLQRCLEFASPEQRFMLVNSVVDCSHLLVQDPFGNYVVQYVLEANEMSVNDAIAKMLLPNFMMLCMNKFSSNVIEKILRLISNTVRDEFVLHLKDLNTLSHLLQDDYGNYVVQTALNVASPQQADQLVQLIRPQMHLIRNAPYAKKLEAKMDLVARKQRGMRHNGPGSFSHRSTDSPMSANYSSPSSSHSSPPHLHHHQSPAHSDHMAASPMHHGPVGASPLNVQHGHQQHHHHHHNHQGAHPHHQQQPFGGQQPVQQPSPVREAPTTPVAQSHPSVNAAPFTPGQHHQGHRRSTPDTPTQGNSPGHHHSPSTANIVAPTTQQQAAPQQAEAREVPVAARGGRYRGGAHGGAHTGGNGQQQHAPASPTAANQQHASSSNNHHEHRGGGGGGGAWKGNRRSH